MKYMKYMEHMEHMEHGTVSIPKSLKGRKGQKRRRSAWIGGAVLCMVVFSCCWGMNTGQARADETGLRQMIGQMVMVGFRGLTVDDDGVRHVLEDIRLGRVGGVILFDYDVFLGLKGRNIVSREQLETLIAALRAGAAIPLLVAVDMEGGKVVRLKPDLGFPVFPSAEEMGRGEPAQTLAIGRQMGDLLRELGFNVNFAPVADVNVNPDNPVIGKLGRSFSSDPNRVVVQAGAFAEGLQRAGIAPCLKHYPGHGSAWNDSHYGMADVTDTWTEMELIPFARLANNGGNMMVMTGHLFNSNLDPEHPATLSEPTIDGVLRRELGFDGVVVTDDMQMKAITDMYGLEQAVYLAITAGADILLFGNNLEYDPLVASRVQDMVLAMVHSGRLSEARIRKSYDRIMTLKQTLR